MTAQILWFNEITIADLLQVGGKNASLGEMITHLTQAGINVPNGFATTARAFQQFIADNQLQDKIAKYLEYLDVADVTALKKAGQSIRDLMLNATLPAPFEQAIRTAYQELLNEAGSNATVAVRSSATAEDLPEASFAGQQETLLNVSGIDAVLLAVKQVFASLYNDRAIAYRVHHHFAHSEVALSAGIQLMVRSDCGASGVAFSIDTESGFDQVVFITASYGLGETIVQGSVNPDEFYVSKPALKANKAAILRRQRGTKAIKMIYADEAAYQKTGKSVVQVPVDEALRQQFCLSDEDVLFLAQQVVQIEAHYQRPMDVEWAKDGINGKLYILQARPETIKSQQKQQLIQRYQLKERTQVLAQGRSIGQKIGVGRARLLRNVQEMAQFVAGDVLVTDMTDPDWEPIMKQAAAIVTNRGGRTCHAAIIAREMGIPAVVGCGNATATIANQTDVTVSCSEGDTGFVYQGQLAFDVQQTSFEKMPQIPVKIMMNVGNPERAFDFQQLPNAGVGLARLEFIINQMIGVHPQALLDYPKLPHELQMAIAQKISGYPSPKDYYVMRLSEGIATIAAAFYPKPVIVRLSDFKSNEYAHLLGGLQYEPREENPMIGYRGASRYLSNGFRPSFELECQALKYVRETMGLTNVEVMVPFVRTVNQAAEVVDLLATLGLKRGEHGLRLIMMCEIPSNALQAEEFLAHFDGFSIGSNDMTQLTLGLDRDSGLVASLFDERNGAVKCLLQQAIRACKRMNKYIGICGQGPSDHPDFARWLLDEGIDSLSLNPDTVVATWLYLAGEKATNML